MIVVGMHCPGVDMMDMSFRRFDTMLTAVPKYLRLLAGQPKSNEELIAEQREAESLI